MRDSLSLDDRLHFTFRDATTLKILYLSYDVSTGRQEMTYRFEFIISLYGNYLKWLLGFRGLFTRVSTVVHVHVLNSGFVYGFYTQTEIFVLSLQNKRSKPCSCDHF